jgi:hypothetical protein
MKLAHLFEGPVQDLTAVEAAREVRTAFIAWLKEHNKDTPVRDTDMRGVSFEDLKAFVVPAVVLGFREMADLSVGIAWHPSGREPTANGHMFVTGNASNIRYFVLVHVDENPMDEIDVIWKLGSAAWSAFIHEMIHYQDYKRGIIDAALNASRKGGSIQTNEKDPSAYINNPYEFNAHYQQGIDAILHMLEMVARDQGESGTSDYRQKYLKSYENFRKHHEWAMPIKLRHLMNPDYKRRYEKRFFKFWQMIATAWPKIDVIERTLERWKEIDASFDDE